MRALHCFTVLILCLSIIVTSAASDNDNGKTKDPPSVLVIGLGPAGLSFLHALAHKRKQLIQTNDFKGLEALPRVTAVERASSPGGIWRDHQITGDEEYRNMYGDLWTNHPKETFEYPDYTFADHFGHQQTPTFLRREHVRDYLLTRVTTVENVFETNDVYFRTVAKNVRYIKQKDQFVATLSHWEEDTDNNSDKKWTTSSTLLFDKVIWCGGWNGIPRYPKQVMEQLEKGQYKGLSLHSLRVDKLDNDSIQDQNIVLIGDNDSANDIAYQMLKRGAKMVNVVSRSDKGSAALLPSWPENKVTIHRNYRVKSVTQDGHGLVLETNKADKTDEDVTIPNVSVVIYCTGYEPNVESLSPDLAYALQNVWHDPKTLPVPSSYKKHGLENDSWDMPEGWKMPNNTLTDELTLLNNGKRDIEPDIAKGATGSYISNKYVYRNVFMYNTNMFFNHETTYQQLFDIDVSAWLILGYITGDVAIPDLKTMKERNQQDIVLQMENPNNRYHLDEEYTKLVDILKNDKEHWFSHGRDRRKRDLYRAEFEVQVKLLARDMHDANYPVTYGSYDITAKGNTNFTMNRFGNDLIEMSVDFYHNKYWIGYTTDESRQLDNPARGWTYRDMDCSTYKSLYSGLGPKPFSGHWLDVDDRGCLDQDVEDCGFPQVFKSASHLFEVRPPPTGGNATVEVEEGIESLFDDVDVSSLGIMLALVAVFLATSIRIAFAEEPEETEPISKSTRPRRFRSLDVLRGLCVFDMIFVHFGEFLSAQWFNTCSLFGTTSFLISAGMGFHVLAESAKRKGQPIAGRAFKRAVFLYMLQGVQSMVLNRNINDLFDCETLMIAGHAQILLSIFHGFQVRHLALLSTAIIGFTGVIRVAFMEADEYWDIKDVKGTVSFDVELDEHLNFDVELEDILRFHTVDGVFPLFPYAAYPIIGLVIGKLLYGHTDQAQTRSRCLKAIAVIGALLVASGVALFVVGKIKPSLIEASLQHGVYIGTWRSWPYESLEHILVSVGRSLLYVVVATRMFDSNTKSDKLSWKGSIRDFFAAFGKYPLTLFTFHHLVIYGMLGIAGLRAGKSYSNMFENVFELKTSLVLGMGFLLGTYRLCLMLEKNSIPTLEHLQRHFCSSQPTNKKMSSAEEDSGSKLGNGPRYDRLLDVLCGVLVCNLIFLHFGESLSPEWFCRYSQFGTPSFMLMAGMSYLSLRDGKAKEL